MSSCIWWPGPIWPPFSQRVAPERLGADGQSPSGMASRGAQTKQCPFSARVSLGIHCMSIRAGSVRQQWTQHRTHKSSTPANNPTPGWATLSRVGRCAFTASLAPAAARRTRATTPARCALRAGAGRPSASPHASLLVPWAGSSGSDSARTSACAGRTGSAQGASARRRATRRSRHTVARPPSRGDARRTTAPSPAPSATRGDAAHRSPSASRRCPPPVQRPPRPSFSIDKPNGARACVNTPCRCEISTP